MAKLTDSKLKTERTKRKLFDANGLYALRSKNADNWWWRIRLIAGKHGEHLSLGTWPDTSLEEARIRAARVNKAAKDGEDPALVAAKLRGAAAPHPVVAREPEPAGDSVEAVVKRWNRWRAANENERASATAKRNDRCLGYLVNALGPSTSMVSVDVHALSAAITKIKTAHKREMAKRALQLANQLWQFAMHERIVPHNPRSGINTKFVLGEDQKGEFSAITEPKPFGVLLRTIDAYTSPITRIALQLLALLFVRPGELRNARWSEFDLDGADPTWTIPVARMKMRSDKDRADHVVPLSKQAVALLRDLYVLRDADGELVCPGLRKGKPISDAVFTTALRQMGIDANTHHAHGFRKSATSMLHGLGFDAETVETQLGHKRPGMRGIYFKAHLLAERRPMMQRWADYLDELRQNHS